MTLIVCTTCLSIAPLRYWVIPAGLEGSDGWLAIEEIWGVTAGWQQQAVMVHLSLSLSHPIHKHTLMYWAVSHSFLSIYVYLETGQMKTVSMCNEDSGLRWAVWRIADQVNTNLTLFIIYINGIFWMAEEVTNRYLDRIHNISSSILYFIIFYFFIKLLRNSIIINHDAVYKCTTTF